MQNILPNYSNISHSASKYTKLPKSIAEIALKRKENMIIAFQMVFAKNTIDISFVTPS
jgi:hypothetical protein